jgi:hypothetical protein
VKNGDEASGDGWQTQEFLDDANQYESNRCMTYLATDLSVQAATSNLSRASETIGGWVGAEVCTA